MVHTDLERVLAWRNHPDVRGYMYTQHEIKLDEHQRWFERRLQDPKNQLLIFEVDQQPSGFVNFTQTGNGGIADWGFYLASDAPKGSGRQLGLLSLSHAFTKLNLQKVCGEALAYNNRSILFHQALGFQQEGTLRDQHFDGERYHNVICFGLLAREWHPTT
jgi:UDP-4-amino-4,6-dideoxy-N-acetyl-beta-L-altrosamine N-acetyltransferase